MRSFLFAPEVGSDSKLDPKTVNVQTIAARHSKMSSGKDVKRFSSKVQLHTCLTRIECLTPIEFCSSTD